MTQGEIYKLGKEAWDRGHVDLSASSDFPTFMCGYKKGVEFMSIKIKEILDTEFFNQDLIDALLDLAE